MALMGMHIRIRSSVCFLQSEPELEQVVSEQVDEPVRGRCHNGERDA